MNIKKAIYYGMVLTGSLLLLQITSIRSAEPAAFQHDESEEPTSTKPVVGFYCNHCKEDFPTEEGYILHTQSPAFPLPNGYKDCKNHRHHPYQHLQRHFCRHCGKYSASPSNNTRHERIHSGKRPFNCPSCERTFVNSSNKRKHEKICQLSPAAEHTTDPNSAMLHIYPEQTLKNTSHQKVSTELPPKLLPLTLAMHIFNRENTNGEPASITNPVASTPPPPLLPLTPPPVPSEKSVTPSRAPLALPEAPREYAVVNPDGTISRIRVRLISDSEESSN